MNEDEQSIVDALLETNNYFRALHEKHDALNKQVDAASHLSRPLDEDELANIKKQKLAAKDKMEEMIAEYRANN